MSKNITKKKYKNTKKQNKNNKFNKTKNNRNINKKNKHNKFNYSKGGNTAYKTSWDPNIISPAFFGYPLEKYDL